MCSGDRFLFDVANVALLAPLRDRAAIRFRQAVLTDCLEHPEVVRDLYELALAAIHEQRRHWGFWSESPESIPSGSLAALESFVGKLRELRAMADTQARVRIRGLPPLLHDAPRRTLGRLL